MIKNEGKDNVKAKIIIGIAEMISGLPHELNKAGINRLAEFIIENHYNLKLAEFKLIGNRLLRNKLYGKLTINTIAEQIDLYFEERTNYYTEHIGEIEIEERNKESAPIPHQVLETINKAVERSKAKRAAERRAEKERQKKLREINAKKVEILRKEYDFKENKVSREVMKQEWNELIQEYGQLNCQRWFCSFEGYTANRKRDSFEKIKRELKDLVI